MSDRKNSEPIDEDFEIDRRRTLKSTAALGIGSLPGIGGTSTMRTTSDSTAEGSDSTLFEDGSSLENWTVANDRFKSRSKFAYEGETSLGINDQENDGHVLNQHVATYGPDELADGEQIESFTAYWLETEDSFGGGMRFVDAAGDVIAGFAADNPEWYVEYREQDTLEQVGETSTGYKDWVKVTVSFDWANDQFTITFENQADPDNSKTVTRDLIKSTDVATVDVQNFANTIDRKDGWTGEDVQSDSYDYSMVMYFDSIETVLAGDNRNEANNNLQIELTDPQLVQRAGSTYTASENPGVRDGNTSKREPVRAQLVENLRTSLVFNLKINSIEQLADKDSVEIVFEVPTTESSTSEVRIEVTKPELKNIANPAETDTRTVPSDEKFRTEIYSKQSLSKVIAQKIENSDTRYPYALLNNNDVWSVQIDDSNASAEVSSNQISINTEDLSITDQPADINVLFVPIKDKKQGERYGKENEGVLKRENYSEYIPKAVEKIKQIYPIKPNQITIQYPEDPSKGIKGSVFFNRKIEKLGDAKQVYQYANDVTAREFDLRVGLVPEGYFDNKAGVHYGFTSLPVQPQAGCLVEPAEDSDNVAPAHEGFHHLSSKPEYTGVFSYKKGGEPTIIHAANEYSNQVVSDWYYFYPSFDKVFDKRSDFPLGVSTSFMQFGGGQAPDTIAWKELVKRGNDDWQPAVPAVRSPGVGE